MPLKETRHLIKLVDRGGLSHFTISDGTQIDGQYFFHSHPFTFHLTADKTIASIYNIKITVPSLVRQTCVSVFNFLSFAKSQKFERIKVMGESRQVTSTFTDTLVEYNV